MSKKIIITPAAVPAVPAERSTASCKLGVPRGPAKALADKIDRYRPDTATVAGRCQARWLKLRAEMQPFYREQQRVRAAIASCPADQLAGLAARLAELSLTVDGFRARIAVEVERKRQAVANGGSDGVLAREAC